ncbi:ABC transporter substrate-binding protein [Corynebacterium variabile]|uniref:Bacterial extracellular solute-binding proteins, family 5 Middle n=1 Tax=Corynebacterium variabile TaxID=1727 RepID=A0A0X2NLB9_9CORY|nr:ABC transporter substrate-binding protein [Corynebacterium variabile]CUU65530.1 Bacterial extracellular solute-binding proteins, family 5 Middle [Corynebacterium variabile]
MRTSRRSTARGVLVATVATATTVSLAACSGSGDDIHADEGLTYVLDEQLLTTNAGSTLGVAADAAKLSARIYPGAYLPGPGGRLLPNSDLVTVTPDPENPDVVDYALAEDANYSDGSPVVCDDFLLTSAAADRTDLFASDLGLTSRISSLDCAPGAKEFRVVFDRGFGQRYREIFGAGEVLPSHTIAEHAGVDSVVDAVDTGDEAALTALGEAWTSTFDLSATDPGTVPTSGPFLIESLRDDADGDEGDRGPSLVLARNPEWHGDRPGLDRITVRGGGDLTRALDGTAEVTDAAVIAGGATDPELTGAGLAVVRDNGVRTDGLTLSHEGIFATADNRRAFASCIDRAAVVDAVSGATGAIVEPHALRIATAGSPAAGALEDLAGRLGARNVQSSKDVLDSTTVRVGYLEGQTRHEAIAESLAGSCAEAGVTVETVPLDAAAMQTPGVLGTEVDALLDTRTPYNRNPEVTASPVSRVRTISQAESRLADDASTIPLVVEPRLVVTASSVSGVSDSGLEPGLSWNMDRWASTDHPRSAEPDETDAPDNTEENQ